MPITTNELLHSDQNFSFLPFHLDRLAEKAGLKTLAWRKAPPEDSLAFSQLMILGKHAPSSRPLRTDPLPRADETWLRALYESRVDYLRKWRAIGTHLCEKTAGARNVYNFGGGMFSYLLACYCAEYWNRVTACTVDGFAGRCLEKKVIPLESLSASAQDRMIIGTRPRLQQDVAERLRRAGWETVRWDDYVEG